MDVYCLKSDDAPLYPYNSPSNLLIPLRVSALNQVDGIERAVDGVMPPEEEAGKRHHLAAAVGRERRDDQGHAQIQENAEPPAPGDEKKERNERDGYPENYRAEPGMAHPVAQRPEDDDVQERDQKQAACYLADQRRGWSTLRNRRSDIDESQQAKHQTRAASTSAYLATDGKSALFRFR